MSRKWSRSNVKKEDKLTKIQEWEKTIWESQGKKGTFKPTTTQFIRAE